MIWQGGFRFIVIVWLWAWTKASITAQWRAMTWIETSTVHHGVVEWLRLDRKEIEVPAQVEWD
jgi:hypothetical protein